MGTRNSCESTHVSTSKLILQDGRLQEFSYPVKVSFVLSKIIINASYFICNADEMEFDDVVSALNDDELLLPGQLYFALPLSWLKHPLQPQEMAALAVKANSVLIHTDHSNNNGVDQYRNRKKSVSLVSFSGDGKSSPGGGRDGSRRGGGRGSRKFRAILSAIPE